MRDCRSHWADYSIRHLAVDVDHLKEERDGVVSWYAMYRDDPA
jgi:hypothetical protein